MSEGSRPTYPRGIEAGAPSVPDSAMKRWAASWYPSMTSQFMTSRSIVALLTVTELSRFAHSASGPLAEDAAGAGASVAAERRAIRGRRIIGLPQVDILGQQSRTLQC